VHDTRLTVREPEDDVEADEPVDEDVDEDDVLVAEADDDEELPPLLEAREPPPAQEAVQAVASARTRPGSSPGTRKRLRRLMVRGHHTA
jgi:hypothetical protein